MEEKSAYNAFIGTGIDGIKHKELILQTDIYKVAFYSVLKHQVKKAKISKKEQAEFVFEALFVGTLQIFFNYGIF